MPHTNEGHRGTFRCPVCGYYDMADLATRDGRGTVSCNYCRTRLEVVARGPASLRFSAQVADAPSPQ